MHESHRLRDVAVPEDVYHELRAIALRALRGERAGHTLQPTALVHEAYLRLARCRRVEPQDRTSFLASAARVMRNLLVDHARARIARLDHERLHVTASAGAMREESFDVLGLQEALEQLAELHARQSRVVEMRVYGGMQIEEIATVLDVSARTVVNDWRMARAWLARRLRGEVP